MDKKADTPIRIRPHHLLCMRGFEGLGYSEAFAGNMARIIKSLKEDPCRMIEITDSADSICGECPSRCGSSCAHDSKVLRYDAAVRDVLDPVLDGERTVSFEKLSGLLDAVVCEEFLMTVCPDCEWRSLSNCWSKICRRKIL